MDIVEAIRSADGSELEGISRSLLDDVNEFNRVMVELAKDFLPSDYEKIAQLLSFVPVKSGVGEVYYVADRREPVGKKYIDMFIDGCRAMKYPEEKYIAVIIGAKNARRGGEYFNWRDGATAYLVKRAQKDFSFVADCIDLYDKRFANYDALLEVDMNKAAARLVDKIVNQKYINKPAIRSVLATCPDIQDALFYMFGKANAHERLAIARILMLFKNEPEVREFLNSAAQNDRSKSVRDLLAGTKRKKPGRPTVFFEKAMMSGEPYSFEEWKELFASERGGEFAAIADRLLFYTLGEFEEMNILVYNDGEFLDESDNIAQLSDDDLIFVLHPIDVPPEKSRVLALNISQPILQLGRPVYYALAGETYSSARLFCTLIDREEFDANFKKLGFAFATDRDNASVMHAVYSIGGYAVSVECGMCEPDFTVDCGKMMFYDESGVVRSNRDIFLFSSRPVLVQSVPRRIYSELVFAVYRLFGCAV